MKTKNIILTAWLILPIATIAGLMAWIFISLDRDRPMSDAPAVGAGAGDTGDANALGQWLAGRDADSVSLANKAKRERRMIAPSDWPGGVEIAVPLSAIGPEPAQVLLTIIHDEPGRFTTINLEIDESGGIARGRINQGSLSQGGRFVIAGSVPSRGDEGFFDQQGHPLRVLTLPPRIPPSDLPVSDPMPVKLNIETVYVDEMP